MSQVWKTTARTVVGIFSLFAIVLILPRPVAALQTALVRTSDGSVYQIRFLNNDSRDIGDFIDDFSIYNQTGDIELCPGNDESVTWELYTAARVLASTPRRTPIYDGSVLVEAAWQAAENQGFSREEDFDGKEILTEVLAERISHKIDVLLFRADNQLIEVGNFILGAPIILTESVGIVGDLIQTEIELRWIFYAFSRAVEYASKAIALQELANHKATQLWNAINAGEVIDIGANPFKINEDSIEISDEVGVFDPLRLRLAAEVYQDHAEEVGEIGAALGVDPEYFEEVKSRLNIPILTDFIATLERFLSFEQERLFMERMDAQLKNYIDLKLRRINHIYDSAASDLQWHGFCEPDLRFVGDHTTYEGYDLTYTVALNSPPDGIASISITSDNPDATVSPAILTFTTSDWFKPKTVRVSTVEDADTLTDTVYLTHTVTGYGDLIPQRLSTTIKDRRGNEFPQPMGTLGPLTLSLDDEFRIDLSEYFNDPDGDRLIYSASDEGSQVLDVVPDRSGSWITIRAREIGQATVVAWAIDTGDLETTRLFTVTVTADQNRAPLADDTIPDQTLTVGDSSAPLDLPTYFHDPDDDLLTYTVVSSDPNVATAQRVGSQLTIWTLNVGNTTVTVRATDPDGLFITQTFSVTVDPAAVQQRPEQVGTIATQYLTLDGGARTVDVAPYFSSPNTLSYTVTASPFGFVTASISVSQVTIRPLQAGSASVFVTARDSQNPDLSAIQSIPVSISHAIIVRPPTPEPFTPPTTNPDVQGLREGVSVITQLSPGFVLNVRERPGTDEEIMEQLGSGVIGTITDGPERADGFRWWEIEWDIRGLDLEGWSAESDRGQVLYRRPPDLKIQDLDVSEDEVEPGDRFTVTVRVRNNGPGESAPTEMHIYYSLERHSNRAEFEADRNKYEVGTINIPSLREDKRIEPSLRVNVPRTPGRYYFGAYLPSNIHPTDYQGDLPSDARENDLASQERVTVTNAPDLIVASISSDTSVLDPGEAFQLEATVRNQGIGEPEDDPTLGYYLSSNPTISRTDTKVGSDALYKRDLDTNETDGASISLTAPNEPGVYYYGICIDDVEHESNTRNNCSGAIAITVRVPAPEPTPDFPDLVPRTPTVSANALAPGAAFTLETTIENRGTSSSRDTTLRWYRSPDPNISSTDTEVGNSRVSSLASGETAPHQLDLNAPAATGTYYYGVGVEEVADENNTANNYSIGVAISVENRAPSAIGTLPPRTLSENSTPIAVDVAEYFSDPDNTALTYTAVSANTAVALADMRGSQVTLTPVGAGDATVTITASDGALTATQTLTVSVVAAPTENEAPVAIDVIPAQSLTVDGASSTVDISAYFSDANGDPLTYAAWPDDTNVVRLRREGTLLTITPKAAGRATVTVRARDPSSLQAFQSISVFVSTTEIPVTDVPAETWMPDANLRAAVREALGLAEGDTITQQKMQGLTRLIVASTEIEDLTGLEHATNLRQFGISHNQVTDITPLTNLTALTHLWIQNTQVSDITPLANLTALTYVSLPGNQISDLTSLQNLTAVYQLELQGNQVSDITPLQNLTALKHLTIGNKIVNITPLQNLTALQDLRLTNNQIVDITPLANLTNLTRLDIDGNPIADTSPLLDLTSQNPDLEIDIEISDKPPSEPDTEIEAEAPDLVVESIRVGKTAVDPGAVFRLDALIKNQGKAASGAATIRFYRSQDATISVEDTLVNRSSLPVVATDATRNKWARLTAPKTAGVYYYGVCIDDVADESDTENNCSTAVKITVGTVPVKPPVVETPATTDPETGEDPLQADLLAKQVFQKHGKILRRRDVKEVLPNVLTTLKEPDIQALLTPATIELVLADPDLLKKTVPTISDKFIALMKTDAEIKTLLSDAQVQTLLQTPTAIDELAKLLGISVAPPSTVGGTVVFRDANLAKKVRAALNLSAGAAIPKAKLATLTRLEASVYGGEGYINDLTGLEHATQLKTLLLVNHRVSNITPLAGLTNLETLNLLASHNRIINIAPLKRLTKLTSLDIGADTEIADFTPLAGLTNLRWLSALGRGIDDNDLTLFTRMTNLQHLGLSSNQISDVTSLAGLTNLRSLDLRSNQISDVTPLARLVNLERLWIGGNSITDEAQFQELLRQNPDLKIYTKDFFNAPSAPVLPNETALLSNYPNPFNPETWIPYQLAAATDVTVTIYDVRGVVVRRLALGHQTVGFYQSRARAAHWDGRNQLGEKVASGLYFYTLTAGEFTATGKMLIRK